MSTAKNINAKKIICSSCQQEILSSARFCNFCGAPVNKPSVGEDLLPEFEDIKRKTQREDFIAGLENTAAQPITDRVINLLKSKEKSLSTPLKKEVKESILRFLKQTNNKQLLGYLAELIINKESKTEYEKIFVNYIKESPAKHIQNILAAELELSPALLKAILDYKNIFSDLQNYWIAQKIKTLLPAQ